MTSGFPEDDYKSPVNFSLAKVVSKVMVIFEVYSSGKNIGNHDDISIKEEHFNRKLPTKFIVHGWLDMKSCPFYKILGETYEQKGKYNIVYVDWSAASHNLYSVVSANTKIIGHYIADFIIAGKFDLDKVHLIGHSLGSQVTGFAAKEVFSKTGRKILRVTALDGAGPKFEGTPVDNRLDGTDAQMVDAVHTDNYHYGYTTPYGRVDFLVNGGRTQPGCPPEAEDTNCSHERSILYFTESIKTNITAYSSESWENYVNGKYDRKKTAIFGENLDLNTRGTFYFATNSTAPFLKSS